MGATRDVRIQHFGEMAVLAARHGETGPRKHHKTSNHLDVYPITSGIFIAWATGSFAVRCWSNRCPRFCVTFQGMRGELLQKELLPHIGRFGALRWPAHKIPRQARLTLCVVGSAHIHDFWLVHECTRLLSRTNRNWEEGITSTKQVASRMNVCS